MAWVEPVTLVGKSVVLRPMAETDAESLLEAGKAPEIWDYLPRRIRTLEEMQALVAEALAQRTTGAEMPFVVEDRATGRLLGSTRLMEITAAHRGLEIGWTWLSSDTWRTRVNSECKHLLLRHAFETLGAIRVQLKTDLRNTRSQAAIERIGGVREGVLRHHRIMPDGYLRDTVVFSILDTEWPAVRLRLEGWLADAA